jgi:DNA-binding transcriptional regulator/RsmH inhibitor MraZ
MDDRGRIKLPVAFKEYLEKFENKRLFVTSLDRRIAQVYPIVLWKQTKKFLENFSEDPEAAENLAFNAADLGAETEMDAQARVLFSPELRRELGLEDQPVHLYAFGGHIEVLNQAVYEERKRAATVKPLVDMARLRRAGMK